jgi:glutathione S-transferase
MFSWTTFTFSLSFGSMPASVFFHPESVPERRDTMRPITSRFLMRSCCAYTRIFTSERYIASSEAEQGLHLKDDVASHGREIVSQAFGILEKRIPAEGYAVGPQFSIADAALFYNEFWADKIGIPLPPRVAAHYQRVRARPVVRQVLAEEGYRS